MFAEASHLLETSMRSRCGTRIFAARPVQELLDERRSVQVGTLIGRLYDIHGKTSEAQMILEEAV